MNKKYSELIPGNTLYILCIDPETNEPIDIFSCIVDSINHSGTVLGVRYVDRTDKSKMSLGYFRVNPNSYINDSLDEDKEHRLMALFETKSDAIDRYILWCESKIQLYKNNITEVGRKFVM